MSNTQPNNPHRIKGARVVGSEYNVKFAFTLEYEVPVISGHHDNDK